MTNEEAIAKLTNVLNDDIYSWSPELLTAFGMAVDALKAETQPTQSNTPNALNALDCIDRQAAIDECNKRGAEHIGYAIAQLPSAQLEVVRCKETMLGGRRFCRGSRRTGISTERGRRNDDGDDLQH